MTEIVHLNVADAHIEFDYEGEPEIVIEDRAHRIYLGMPVEDVQALIKELQKQVAGIRRYYAKMELAKAALEKRNS